MQELNVQPTNPTPYTPAGGMYNFNPTPGAGGLPALSGLSRNVNPMAQELQAQGRGEDTMLVHMTPDEVNSLQGLAMQTGTTMTINPNTGLPEAGLLGKVFKKLLPALAGAGLMFIPGVNAIAAAGIVGGGSTLLTGSLKKGLMAGLSAYGGASLARGLGAGVASAAKQTATEAAKAAAGDVAMLPGGQQVASLAPQGLSSLPSNLNTIASGARGAVSAAGLPTQAFAAAKNVANPGLMSRFSTAARAGLPGGVIGKAAPMLATTGLVNTLGEVDKAIQQGSGKGPVNQDTWVNEGPYMPTRRTLAPRLTGPGGRGEIMYFDEPDFGGYLTASGQLRGLPGATQPQSYAAEGLTGFAEGGSTDDNKTYSYDKKYIDDQFNALKARVDAAAKLAPNSFATDFQKFMNSATDKQKDAMFTGNFQETILDNKTSGWRLNETAKAIEGFKPNDKAADSYAYLAMTTGFKDPVTGQVATLADPAKTTGLKPGQQSQIGDKMFTLDENGRWKTTGDSIYRPQTWLFDEGRVDWGKIGKGLTLTNTGGGGGGGGGTGSNTSTNTSTSTNTATNTTNTVTGTPPGTPTTKVPGLPTGTTPSGYGVYTLPDRYTPQFTKVEDFVTEKVNPYTGGTEQTNKLEEYIRSYRTSPGPLKSTSLGYAPGQSPSERNRAYALELAKQAEAERRAAATTTTSNAAVGADTGGYYYNPANGQTYTNPNFTGAVFNPVTGQFEMPVPGPGNSFARGGIYMDDGAFVVDARTVSELGNGSSSAGQELLARLGGRPVKGPGDGVSDSIRANIGGRQEARVARDEVIFPAKAVKKLGGAKKLYALMDKAHKARKKAGRGSDTQLRKGLGAL